MFVSLSIFPPFNLSSQKYLNKVKNKQSLWISNLEQVCNIFHSVWSNIFASEMSFLLYK